MALSAALIWAWSTHQTLVGDEWGYAIRTATEPASQYLLQPPPGKHLIAIPLLGYKVAFDTFGIDSYVPYRVAHIVLLLLCAALFYALARRRVGDTLAVLPTAILLFCGTSWEVIATPLRMPSLVAIAAGLGMLLVLERRDLLGDVAACILLALSLASHSTGLAFAAAAVVLVLSRPAPERWRRLWVFAVPIAAYAVWWLLEFERGTSRSFGSVLLDLPAYLAKSLGATLLATTGLLTHAEYGGINISGAARAVLALALVALLAWVVITRLRRPATITPFAWAMVAALVVFWLATAFAPGLGRSPAESRYLYPDVLLFLLVLCEIGRDFKLPDALTPRVAIALVALFAISIAANLYQLRVQERAIDSASDRERAALTSLAFQAGSVPPQFSLADTLAGRFQGSDLITELAPPALARVFASYGSPAYSPTGLAARPQTTRITADYVSLQLAGGDLREVPRSPKPISPPPRPLGAIGGRWTPAHGCIALRPSGGPATGLLSVAGAHVAITAGPGPAVPVRAGRFAEGVPVPIGSVPGGDAAVLELPVNDAATPDWRIGVHAEQRVVACSG